MAGRHNSDLLASRSRLIQGQTYKDLSTVVVIPTRGRDGIPPRVVESWLNLMMPMNQKIYRLFVSGNEVGDAYNTGVQIILSNPELSKWKFMLTIEEDNIPPPDGLLRLYESIEGYAAVGALYWTKGEGGQPMIYGNPAESPMSFRPQLPAIDTVQRCLGLGMGFTLFRLKLFKDPKFAAPWFRTEQRYTPGIGVSQFTQDLWAFQRIHELGYRVACDTRVKVGHYDPQTDIVW